MQQLFSEKYKQVKAFHLEWAHEQVFKKTMQLVAPIVNLDGSRNTPPHSTGGAIDVYLVDEKGTPVDMGIHPKDWMQDEGGIFFQTDSKKISEQEHLHRNIMSGVLSKAGVVNYPKEYWHWSFGDHYWAYYAGSSKALYGTI